MIDLGVVSTPGVAMMVKHLGADAGIVATASHNPIQWNGLKFLSREAVALRRRRPIGSSSFSSTPSPGSCRWKASSRRSRAAKLTRCT